jgi:hypothetical protein
MSDAPVSNLGQTIGDQSLSNISCGVLNGSKKVVAILSNQFKDDADLTLEKARLDKVLGLTESK